MSFCEKSIYLTSHLENCLLCLDIEKEFQMGAGVLCGGCVQIGLASPVNRGLGKT